ncbi:hypothetical protein CVO76_07110 [Arthrobacter agilis]|uniref:DUF4397 domain-containing protein n=1 Tax=Arthrobacter agilis TaxID=37921 RepID=A0A2L0UDR7_9MICC|nr:DUF4397 domain-containing protein [Arthrobacter agilis]AUZ87423.1 hypothetical protein CVO76_07110 [Arthrobacter agilis]
MQRSLYAVGAAAVVGAASIAAPATAAETPAVASLSVLHGVPDLTVDVYVNGALTLDDFAPGELAGPLELPAGAYQLAVTAADAADASAPLIGPVDVNLAAGGNYTATANLDAEGNPTANFYTNDLSTVEAGKTRVTVRHVAAAPAVDVLAGGAPILQNLSNPGEASLTTDAGTVSASVAATGTTAPVIGPADLTLPEGTSTIVYAWGSLEAGNLALATQVIEGLHSAPGAVPGGQSGLAAEDDNGAAVGIGAFLLVLLGGAAAASRRRAVRVSS